MTATTGEAPDAVVLPLRPSQGRAKPTAQPAPTRVTRTHEERPPSPASGPRQAGPAAGVTAVASGAAAGPVPRTSRLRGRVEVSALRSVFEGASLLDAKPPSLAAVWAKHRTSAEYYSAGAVRWPRYVFAVAQMPVAAVLYFTVWATDSPPKLAVTAAVLVAVLLALHVI